MALCDLVFIETLQDVANFLARHITGNYTEHLKCHTLARQKLAPQHVSGFWNNRGRLFFNGGSV